MADTIVVPMASKREILDRIERLTVSADAKVLLHQLAGVTMRVGNQLVEVGRCILSFVFEAVKLFPHIALGVVVGFTMWWLIGSAALLGALLGPILGPLLVAFGLGMGAIADVADGGLRSRVEDFAGSFDPADRN
ncbi:hypothetical protein [Sphingomonas sp. Leaf22]|uniref:hypothetical protein n=1 Tax=Sphingomonas sp. Leaf22 TaxID=1735687 RepID=UPI000A9593BF|nr:hypothetical protein [Sphingomonas sp. Leaf22]